MARAAVVALAVLTVIGMTTAPVLANSTTSGGDDCDLVDVDGDHNEVSVDMHQKNSEFNINCGSGGGDGGDGADDFGGMAEDDDDNDGAIDENDEPDSGNSDETDNDAVDEDDERDGSDGMSGDD